VTVRAARCYRDAIIYQSRQYLGRPARLVRDMQDIHLGPVAFTVRDTLARRDNGDPYNAPKMVDEGATFLPVGTPVHEIVGFPASSRLAAYLAGKLQIYIAEDPAG
jgi:hypothetical protein